MELQNVKMCS